MFYSVLGDRRVFPSKWADPSGGGVTEQGALYQTRLLLLSLTTSALQRRSLSPEQLTASRALGALPAFPLLENWELKPWTKKQENLM